jgi:hypothetical protein
MAGHTGAEDRAPQPWGAPYDCTRGRWRIPGRAGMTRINRGCDALWMTRKGGKRDVLGIHPEIAWRQSLIDVSQS